MKNGVSLICTVFNEENTIIPLLESINTQSLKPAEIIMADAGSTDDTQQLINEFTHTHKLAIRLYKKKSNRSQGRNYAITKAKHNIIAVTDAGCVLHKNWLERITQPLRDDVADSVAGFYCPITPTLFQKAVAPFVAVLPQDFDPSEFLPSSRSVAFTKRAWELAGKYPSNLNYCEDLVFAMHLKSNTKMVTKKNAIVYWTQKKTFGEFFHQIKNYARGDIEASYKPHTIKIASVFVRYLIFFVYPPFFLIYLVWPVFKLRKKLEDALAFYYLPGLQITADFAVMTGAIIGIINKIRD